MIEEVVWERYRNGLFSHAYLSAGRLQAAPQGPLFTRDFHLQINPVQSYFDLASLTKALVALPLFWGEEQKKPGFLNLALRDWLPKVRHKSLPHTLLSRTAGEILSHRAGIPAWRSLYLYEAFLNKALKQEEIITEVLCRDAHSLKGVGQACYSDLGYMLLGVCWQWAKGKSIAESFVDLLGQLGGGLDQELFFASETKKEPGQFVPTAYCKLRKRWLVGEVHDENGFVLKGVSAHAGLFGSGKGVEAFLGAWLSTESGKLFLNSCTGSKPRFFEEGFSSAGYFPGWQSYGLKTKTEPSLLVGHLGFTGVGFWVDPSSLAPKLMLLLTNRVRKERVSGEMSAFRKEVWENLWSKINP